MRKNLLLLMISFLAFILTACAANSGVDEDREKVTVMLDWYPNAVHTYLYVAKEKGYFADEGMDVEFQFPANPTDPLTLAAAGKITLGMYYQPDVIQAVANENIPVVSVASIVRSPLNHLVFRADLPIERPRELEGKKVGYPGIPLNEALVKTIVDADGGDNSKVDLINVEFELSSSLITKQVDAVSGAFVNHEVPQLRSEGHAVDYINPSEHGVPTYHEIVLVTSKETWEKEEDKIESFWRAAKKGYDFMVDHREEALQILLDQQDEANFPLSKEVEIESLDILLPKMFSETGFGAQDEQSWIETAKWLKEYDLIQDIPEIDDLIVHLEP